MHAACAGVPTRTDIELVIVVRRSYPSTARQMGGTTNWRHCTPLSDLAKIISNWRDSVNAPRSSREGEKYYNCLSIGRLILVQVINNIFVA